MKSNVFEEGAMKVVKVSSGFNLCTFCLKSLFSMLFFDYSIFCSFLTLGFVRSAKKYLIFAKFFNSIFNNFQRLPYSNVYFPFHHKSLDTPKTFFKQHFIPFQPVPLKSIFFSAVKCYLRPIYFIRILDRSCCLFWLFCFCTSFFVSYSTLEHDINSLWLVFAVFISGYKMADIKVYCYLTLMFFFSSNACLSFLRRDFYIEIKL